MKQPLDKNNCIGVFFSAKSNFDLNSFLSQMAKTQLETNIKYFYIFSDNYDLKLKIANEFFQNITFCCGTNKEEGELFKKIEYFVSTEEDSKSPYLKNKKVSIPSERSFYFNIKEADILRLV